MICPWCGKEFEKHRDTQRYCSEKCQRAAMKDRQKKVRYIEKRRLFPVHISLPALFIRDRGRCQICGRECDFNDWHMSPSGAFVMGDSYPTIDHIVPLARNGKHMHNNVQLACFSCNCKLKRESTQEKARADVYKGNIPFARYAFCRHCESSFPVLRKSQYHVAERNGIKVNLAVCPLCGRTAVMRAR